MYPKKTDGAPGGTDGLRPVLELAEAPLVEANPDFVVTVSAGKDAGGFTIHLNRIPAEVLKVPGQKREPIVVALGAGSVKKTTANLNDLAKTEADKRNVPEKFKGEWPQTIIASHEIGHVLRISHPGVIVDGASKEDNPFSEYIKDPYSLMGSGMDMRGYYFTKWQRYLDKNQAAFGPWSILLDMKHKNAKETKERYEFYVRDRNVQKKIPLESPAD